MLLTAAIVPGPPAFVPELMGSAAHELDDLRDAADSVVSRVVSDLVAAQLIRRLIRRWFRLQVPVRQVLPQQALAQCSW